MDENTILMNIKNISRTITDKIEDLDPLIPQIENRKLVLLGEASHGTHEYYSFRKEISKKLIEKKGFNFIAVEGDWPDCYRINRYVKDYPDAGGSAYEVLHAFNRWPTWMWANWDIVELVEWLREFNKDLPDEKKIGFYGLDVYSLWESLHEIINYLKKVDPDAVDLAIKAYACFEPYSQDPQVYAHSTAFVPESCENEVVNLLKDIQRSIPKFKDIQKEDQFNLEQNAHTLKNAEEYYRTMIYGGSNSWNIRDTHMMETLDRLLGFYGKDSKGIVWAHNTHIGDSTYTDMKRAGMINIGLLVREEHGEDNVCLIGFGSFEGSVIASSAWYGPIKKMLLPKAQSGSWEKLLHSLSDKDKLLIFKGSDISKDLVEPIGHRAVGVVYDPDSESGNYVPSIIPKRYDAFLYFDKTRALKPLHLEPKEDKDWPETYPYAY